MLVYWTSQQDRPYCTVDIVHQYCHHVGGAEVTKIVKDTIHALAF